jgi:hypothetical protein
MEVCCLQSCMSRPSSAPFNFDLAFENLILDYKCEAMFWSNSTHASPATITCPAVDSCELFNCYFCSDALLNPTCNIQWATFMYTLIFALVFSLLGFILAWCHSVQRCLRFFCTIVTFILSGPLRLAYWATGRRYTKADRDRVKERLHRGTQNAAVHVRKSARIAQRRTQQILGSLFTSAVLSATRASSETIAMTTRSESCQQTPSGLACTVNSQTTLTLLPANQLNTLLVRDDHGLTLATLNIRLMALTLQCQPHTDAWLRSYEIETLAVKRCARAGSCFDDHCTSVRPNSTISELKAAHQFPGNSHCVASTYFMQCGLPSPSCLYYKNFVRPTSADPFELFSCPGWTPKITVQATFGIQTSPGNCTSPLKGEWPPPVC